MYLKSIELSGFKSFAKSSVLAFNSRITSIVGPNGSGKSNVAEAFRFVLGEQSIKSLRGKRGEDLIWNGGGGEPRANRALVKVVFDNTSKVFAIDFPEVTIERIVHRDGVNEYRINGSAVRLKDVLELLAGAHIGASGHHIISQGEADKMLGATPKDRKAMIEDALGLKVYQYKRLESERKLKKTFENIAQVESLRREIAPHLKFLRRQVEKFEKAESDRLKLIELSKEYFRLEEAYLSRSKAALAAERAPLEAELGRLRTELAAAKKVLEDASKAEKRDFAALGLESDLAAVRSMKDALSRELGRTEGLLGAEERTIARERSLADSEDHKMIRLREVETLAEEVSRLSAAREIIERIKLFIKERKHLVDSAALLEAERSFSSLAKEKERIEHDLREAAKRENELGSELERLKREIESGKDSSRDAEKTVFRIMSEEQSLLAAENLIKTRETALAAEESDWKRILEETGRLVGAEALHFKGTAVEPEGDREKQRERKSALERLRIRLEDAGIADADDALKEYKETAERDEFLARELLDLERSAESLKQLIAELEERLAVEFSTGVQKINTEFNAFFTRMFGGGEARLSLIKERRQAADFSEDEAADEEEAVEVGLDISVSLPKKKIRGLQMLSGGERALTSIALLFAVSQVNPPPFVILDETDAALDEANSKRYGDMVEALAEHSQLILITHNRETMSRAGMIYGVTMGSTGISKLLSVAFDEAVVVAK